MINHKCQDKLNAVQDSFRRGVTTQPETECDVSLVIPTLGRAILESSLVHVVTGSAWPARIIVVDQGQQEKIALWLQILESIGLPSDYVPSAQSGRAAGLNRGLERVKTKFVMITDDDCFVDRDWVLNMARRLRKYPESVISGSVTSTGNQKAPMTVESPRERIQRRPGLKFDAMSGGNMGTSMELVRRVGMFDESHYVVTAEDCDWAYRVLKIGAKIVYAPEVTVAHYGWRETLERKEQFASYAKSHGGFYGKHLRNGDLIILIRIVIHHLRELRRWIIGTLKGDDELAWIGRAYFTGLMPGIIAGWRGAKLQR
jgi:cellulose synthase/poly-beta-1,6-N-acetylglucosamine synthase-like glycosyltransferase